MHARSTSSHPVQPGGFAPGTVHANRYRIVSLAGRGGMGEVYRADDLKLGQPVALKFLPEALERALEQFVYYTPAGVPWTLDPSRWYFWQGMFALAMVAALAFWGFKNVLGKQPAFPAGALDG
jgi:hypothetical protein